MERLERGCVLTRTSCQLEGGRALVCLLVSEGYFEKRANVRGASVRFVALALIYESLCPPPTNLAQLEVGI